MITYKEQVKNKQLAEFTDSKKKKDDEGEMD